MALLPPLELDAILFTESLDLSITHSALQLLHVGFDGPSGPQCLWILWWFVMKFVLCFCVLPSKWESACHRIISIAFFSLCFAHLLIFLKQFSMGIWREKKARKPFDNSSHPKYVLQFNRLSARIYSWWCTGRNDAGAQEQLRCIDGGAPYLTKLDKWLENLARTALHLRLWV